MQFDGRVMLDGNAEQVWSSLMDPVVLAKCLPGCEGLEADGEDQYVAHVSLGVAAIKGKYDGRVRISDKEANRSYKLLIDGSGGPGWVDATMDVNLTETDGTTELFYRVEAQVGGLIASVGGRLLSGIGKMLIKDMFKELNKHLLTISQS